MARKTPVEMLGKVSLFEGLSRKELRLIETKAREVHFPAGSTIVTQGDEGVGFHMIISGRAKVIVNGRTRDTLGAGKSFGELSVIDRGPRTATVVAETDVTTMSLTSWQFMPILDRNPSIARKIVLELTRRLRDERDHYSH
jgi:CRP/FNR family transcriptional regulator, cyclic AMP receptor protein